MLLTRAPVAGGKNRSSFPAAPRLACVKPVASVHPEPGSNSSLFVILFFFSFEIMRTKIFVFVLLLNNPERFRRARRLRSVRPGTTLDLLSFKEIDLGHSLFNDSCTVSLSIANISMFSAAFVLPKCFAKLRTIFELPKFF